MSTEIADAYIALYTKMPGVQKDIEKHLDGAAPAGVSSGKTIGDSVLSGMGSVLKGGAIAVAGLAVAALGTAMVKGFQRLDALDQAEAKLRGLGHSAENVELIMNDALASVKGTAFGMGDAATVAAATVAAGVKPGEDLQRTLKLVADAATIAGVDMSTMGSIVNKVATSDLMQMDVANQLMDAGIPILQMVGETMGVTAEEARKMASAGEISFETFQTALEAGLGGAALESGNTFSGAMDNVMAALGRIGEALLGGVFENLKGGFGDLNVLLDDLQPAFAEIGERIGEVAAVAIPAMIDGARNLIDALVTVGQWIQDNSTWLVPLAIAVGTAATAFIAWKVAVAAYTKVQTAATAAMKLFNTATKANVIGIIVTAIAGLVAGLIWFFTETELGQEIWANFTQFLGDAWNWLWESVLQPVIQWIGDALTWLWEVVIQPTAQFIGDAVTAVGEFFTWLWTEAIQPALQAIGDFFTWIYDYIIMPVIVGIMTYVGLWAALFQWLWEAVVQPVLQGIGDLFSWLWTNAIKPAIDWISGALEAVGAVFSWLWENAVQPALRAIGDFFGWLWSSVVDFYSQRIRAAIDLVGAIFSWLWENAVKPAIDGVASAFRWVYDTVIRPVADWISDAIEAVGSTVESVFGGIGDFIASAFQKAVDLVKRPLNALIDLVNGAIAGINSISVDIPDWVPVVGGTTFSPSIPSIPRLAEGGIVAARPGGIIANVGEGRYDEAVLPLDEKFYETLSGGGGDVTIVVQGDIRDQGTAVDLARDVKNARDRRGVFA